MVSQIILVVIRLFFEYDELNELCLHKFKFKYIDQKVQQLNSAKKK